MTRINLLRAAVAALTTMVLAACGTAAGDGGTVDADPAGGVAGMCAEDQPDCIDTPQLTDDEPVEIDETGIEQLRRDAQFYLGKREDELNELVRVGRIGDERMALTEDYQVGRITVELDDLDGDGIATVTTAIVELPGGPETFEFGK